MASAHIRSHDDDRVAEVDRAALRIGKAAFLENLQQDVEHIGMRLLDFVEQHDRIRTLANGFGKLAALVEAHIARRRTDQAAHAVLLHVFRHVVRDKRVFGAEQELSERLGKLGFAHARRTKENERAAGALRIFQAGAAAANGLRQGRHSLLLADDALVQHAFHTQKLIGFGFGEVAHGHARRHAHHVGDFGLGDVGELLVAFLGKTLFSFGALLLKLLFFVAKLRGALEFLRRRRLFLVKANAAKLVVELANLIGQRAIANAHARASLVEHVDCLIGQEAVLDITRRHRDGGLQRLVGITHVMVRLVAVAKAVENAQSLFLARLFHVHRLEATGERGIFFEMLAIFLGSGGSNYLQLATRQRRLQNSGGVDGAFSGTRANDGMHFVDEQNDVAVFDDFLDDLLQALFELAAVFATCDQRGHVEGDHALARDDIGHLIGHDELRQAFDHGGFAHAGLADEQRVVLLAAREHLHHAFDFGRTTDNGIELARLGFRGKVGAELLEHALLAMGLAAKKRHARSHRSRLIDQIVERGTNGVDFDTELCHRIDSAALALTHNAKQ